MKILMRQLLFGELPLDMLSVPDKLLTRAAIEEDVNLDRFAHAFKDRVRTAALLSRPAVPMPQAKIDLYVTAAFDAGLLHVEKLVVDALTEAGWLIGDRLDHLTSVRIFRRIKSNEPESITVRVFGPSGSQMRLERVQTPVHEWRTLTPKGDYRLRGRWTSPAEYHQALRDSIGDALQIDDEMREFLRQLFALDYRSSWTTNLELKMEFGVAPTSAKFDLDNAALFVLDGIALWGKDAGFDQSLALDRMARRVSVKGAYERSNRVSVMFGHRLKPSEARPI